MTFPPINFTEPATVLILYLCGINLLTFIFFGIDKMKAGLHHWRIPERTLFVLTLLGGSVGALAAIKLFRHKTKKSSFQAVLTLIILLQALCIFLFLNYAG